MTLDLANRIALVTGAANGLGRAHALALARYGARVVVNDLNPDSAEAVAADIQEAGGEAISHACSVTDFEAVRTMVDAVRSQWGRVDILVNNAGILRDKTFAKMSLEDFRLVLEVHLMGSFHCTKAVWDPMREQGFGRIVMTTSSSGLWGNFGQSNYGAAKMALVGLMQTLGLEGERHNIRVNCLAPTAATQMTQGVLPDDLLRDLDPSRVSPAVVYLASDEAPNRAIVCAGAGSFERAYVTMTQGFHVGFADDAAQSLAARFEAISSRASDMAPHSALQQGQHELTLLKSGLPG
jgi:NAD(P)-dependent dehydrogenase (short-subunit alcohol dehydrogenase family)